MAAELPLRTYRAPCPGCGAPVDFASAQSTHAVCAYCQSTLVRQGEVLQRLGKMAELFDDHSPLQLHATGTWGGQGFTLVGRLQYRYGEGRWTEWHALRGDGSSAFLSEDNGAYVMATPLPPAAQGRELPPAERFKVGATTAISGRSFTVASVQQVALVAAQGELPRLPALGEPHTLVELRSQAGTDPSARAIEEVLSLDYSTQPPTVSRGVPVRLDELGLAGLREEISKTEEGRAFNCPHCGSPLTVQLAHTQSLTCASCHSLIDISQGIGGELAHALQDEPIEPLIPLGSQGLLHGANWQVVGFQHRLGHDPQEPDEHFGWEEYLLYNPQRGFLFLVDSVDGWSLVKPTTGTPVVSEQPPTATYLGTRYALQEAYEAQTSYVQGEFYWQVQRGQKTFNRDYRNGKHVLSSEQSAQELVWSQGGRIDSSLVAKAFKLEQKAELLKRSDVGPVSAQAAMGTRVAVVIFLLLVLFIVLASRCSDCDPATQNCSSGYASRSSGGSFGGFSTGGGHK